MKIENYRTWYKEVPLLWEEKKEQRDAIEKKHRNFTGTIFILSDYHGLTVRADLIYNHIIPKMQKTKGDILVVKAGDLVDFSIFSVFLKLPGEELGVIKEMQCIQQIFNDMRKIRNIKDFIYIKANHEARIDKFLVRIVGTPHAKILQQMGINLKEQLGLPFVHLIDDWFVRIGDMIACHPEKKSTIQGRTSQNVMEWFLNRNFDFKTCYVAHTHAQSIIPYGINHWGIEIGALCRVQDYARKGDKLYKQPQTLGYGICEMEKGKSVDYRFINLGAEEKL